MKCNTFLFFIYRRSDEVEKRSMGEKRGRQKRETSAVRTERDVHGERDER